MSKRGSPVFQVQRALDKIFRPGESRHTAKAGGVADNYIYSFSTRQAYGESASRFACWARDTYGVRDIRKITPQMAKEYIDFLSGRELSGGYIGRVKAAIGKLSFALHGKKWDLGYGFHSDPRPDRAYTVQQAREIEANLRQRARDPQIADVVKLQRIAGLRVREAASLRGQDIDADGCRLHIAKGAKGGRPRDVQVDEAHHAYLVKLKDKAAQRPDGYVFQGRGGLPKRVGRAVGEACKRLGIQAQGTHGFRGGFAQARYRRYRDQGLDDDGARRRVARELGHGRKEVTYSYIPRDAA